MHEISAWNNIWIGLQNTNMDLPNFWAWTDNTPVTYTDWAPNFPMNASFCTYMTSSGSPYNNGLRIWANNVNCSDRDTTGFMCKQSPVCM
jgi:hypothetical protein